MTDPIVFVGVIFTLLGIAFTAVEAHRRWRDRHESRRAARARDEARHHANRVPAIELALFGDDWRDPVRPYARTRDERDRRFAYLVSLADEFREGCR